MGRADKRRVRAAADIYTEPGVEWYVRLCGTHLYPGVDEATVALVERAGYGMLVCRRRSL